MVLSWCKSELSTDRYGKHMRSGLADLIQLDNSSITDALVNRHRLRSLIEIRPSLLCEIPSDTSWYRIPLIQLHNNRSTIRLPWSHDHIKLMSRDDSKDSILDINLCNVIAWGHDCNDIMIIEGNHRILQWQLNGCKLTSAAIIVGISSSYYYWFTENGAHPPSIFNFHEA
jgi:hypothetical protein